MKLVSQSWKLTSRRGLDEVLVVQFPLNKKVTCADYLARICVFDDEYVVGVLRQYPVISLGESLFADLADGGENAQTVEEAGIVVR